MTNHQIHYVVQTNGKHVARCKCPYTSPFVDSRQEAEDEALKHMRAVEVARAGLSTKTPSLKQQRDYYLKQMNEAGVTATDRRLWKQLADELSVRLNDGEGHVEGEQELLW